MLIHSLDPACTLAPALALALDETLAPHEDRAFEDGEHKWRPLTDPRGQDAYVVASLHGGPAESPHDKLVRLLMFVATLRDHGAARVTAVVPYLAYARKDRRTKPFDPLALRYVAQLFEAVGTDQLIVLEPHDVGAFQNAFRRPVQALSAHPAFDAVVDELAARTKGGLAVASPDPGGVKRAQLWRESLETRLGRPVGFAMVDKRRSGGVVSSLRLVAGEVAGATVLLLDDLIASGETMQRAAAALREAGARRGARLRRARPLRRPRRPGAGRPGDRTRVGLRRRASLPPAGRRRAARQAAGRLGRAPARCRDQGQPRGVVALKASPRSKASSARSARVT